MKFRCERDVLVDALATASRAVSSRGGGTAAQSGVRVSLTGDELRLTGHDVDLTISSWREVAGMADGEALLPARLFADIVRAVPPGAVVVEVVDDSAQVTAGRSTFSLNLVPSDTFPIVTDPDVAPVVVDGRSLAQALRQVVPAASTDDSRPMLTGVLMVAESGGLRLVATDSYRLAVRDLRDAQMLAEGQKVLLPSRALNELARMAAGVEKVEVRLGANDASFECGNNRLTTRLIDLDFPQYGQILSKTDAYGNRLVVGREALLDAVRRVRLLARETTRIRLDQGEDTLELLAVSQEYGQARESVDAMFTGTPVSIAFNPDYLVAGLEAISADEVALVSESVGQPVILRGVDDDDLQYLIMPVRVN